MAGTAASNKKYVPRRFVSTIARASDGPAASPIRVVPVSPALATTMSRRPQSSRARSDGSLCLGLVSRIPDEVAGLPSGVRHFAHRLAEGAFVSSGDEDAHAQACKLEGDGSANPPAAPGDDRDLALERVRIHRP